MTVAMKNRPVRLVSLLCVLVLIVTALPIGALASSTAYVRTSNGKSLNVRSSMLTGCNNRIAYVANGTKVTVLSTSGEWSYIKFTSSGKTVKGYVQSRYLVKNDSSAKGVVAEKLTTLSTAKTATVNPSHTNGWVNMRSATLTTSQVLGRYKKGAVLKVTAVGTNWCKVYDPSTGKTGYMMKKFLKY